MTFLKELMRRNVLRIGIAYLVVAWILVQIVNNVAAPLNLPPWTPTFVILLLGIGLPVALIIAWAFELTPEGVKRTGSPGMEPPADAAAARIPTTPSPAQEIRRAVLPNSVAVLPFENLSPKPDDAYFAAGIHDEILNYLAKLKSLNVIARTSMVQYADTNKSIPQIAAELNVETVMEGSVRYAGNRVRVTTQLIDAATGAHIWSEAYEREFEDIFAIQADIAMNVANALNAEFSPQEQRELEQRPTESTTAYALYLQVLNLIGMGNQGPQVLALLGQIIENDPEFAAAYGYKAYICANMLINTTISSAGDVTRLAAQARDNAERALTIDPNNAWAQGALGHLALFGWRWSEAREIYERLWRTTGQGAFYYDWFNSWMGRHDRAIELAERGVALDPLVWSSHWSLGIVLTYAGKYDLAVAAFREGIRLAPALSLQHSWLAMAEIGHGDTSGALRELQHAEQLLGGNRVLINLVDLTYAYGRVGRDEDAQRLFAELESLAAQQDIGAGGWALARLGIGDQQGALERLQEGAEKAARRESDPGFFSLMNIKANFTGDPVLEQPRFVEARNRLTGD